MIKFAKSNQDIVNINQIRKIRKRLSYVLCVFLCMMTSCLEKGLYQEPEIDPGKPVAPATDDFTFQTKDDVTLRVEAIDGNGNYVADTKFYFFADVPYNEEGDWQNPSVLFFGKTDGSGVLNASFTLPSGLKKIYVQGFGFLQTYDVESGTKSLTFRVPAFEYVATTKAVLRSEEQSYPSIAVHPNAKNFYNTYTFYEGAEGMYDEEPAYMYLNDVKTESFYARPRAGVSLSATGAPLINYKGIVSKDPKGAQLRSIAETLYPEKGMGFKQENKYLLEGRNSTDLVDTSDNEAEIWATYLSDGSFYEQNDQVSYNSLCYYHYNEGETPDAKTIRKTVLFPNTDPFCTPAGTKVQLLYWDGSKYVKTFPKGTKIGWCYIQNGYGKRGNARDSANRFSEPRYSNIQYYRFSTASMNSVARSANGVSPTPTYNQAVALWSDIAQCTFVGVENRWALTKKDGREDDDFNDVLIAVVANPVVKPENDISGSLPDEEKEIKSEQCGTLAFEDMHPQKGDYDHNDVVIDYTYSLVKNTDARLIAVEATFTPRAAGGLREAGFGIEFPQLGKTNAEGMLEADCNTPVVIVYESVRNCFGSGLSGMINTYPNLPHYEASSSTVRVDLKTPLSGEESNNFTVLKFNPFIFVDTRANETHLIDYRPTSKNNNSTFGVQEDHSDGLKTFYRSNNGYAWALDITKASPSDPSWTYPIETKSIVDAYPGYENWATGDHANLDWFNKGNGISEFLYSPKVDEPEVDENQK